MAHLLADSTEVLTGSLKVYQTKDNHGMTELRIVPMVYRGRTDNIIILVFNDIIIIMIFGFEFLLFFWKSIICESN